MSPNGRRAWRVAAKKLRRKIGRRVRDLDHRSTPISGAWFRRHGFTMDDPRYQIRQYIGTWGTVDGDGVEFAIKPASFTPRSLVGMTQGARKRAWLSNALYPVVFTSGIVTDETEMQAGYSWQEIRDDWPLLGQRLRPCPGCEECRGYDDGIGVLHCDGSGVLPARKSK